MTPIVENRNWRKIFGLCIAILFTIGSGILTLWGLLTVGNVAGSETDYSGLLLLLFFAPIFFGSLIVTLTEIERL